MMKFLKPVVAAVVAAAYLTGPAVALAADKADKPKTDKAAAKPKPYTLKTCLVADEPFGGDMGEPYVFTHEGREIKLCCKSCLKDFKKSTAKYIKKLEVAEKKAAEKKPAEKKPEKAK